MKFCRFLYNHINFMPTAIQPCCNVRAVGVPQFNFTGGYVDMEKYARHIEHVTQKLQEQTPEYCMNCPELREVENINTTFAFQTITMSPHYYHCNCKCIYCNLWNVKDKAQPYSMIDPIKSLFEQNVIKKNASFHWGGGESSILKGFEETSHWILEHGHLQYVHTNALKYSHAMAYFLSRGMGFVNISLDSPNAEIYKKVKGINGWNVVIENIKKYLDASLKKKQIHIKYIIFKENNSSKNIMDFFDVITKLGIQHVEYSFNFHEINHNELDEKSLEAALLFICLAQKNNIDCEPFYVDPAIVERLKERATRPLIIPK